MFKNQIQFLFRSSGLLLAAFLLFSTGGCVNARYQGPPSDHFNGREFFLPDPLEPKGFSSFLKWQWTREQAPWPKFVENLATPAVAKEVGANELVVTFVNHATVLLQFSGLNVLTDPIWSERASPLTFAGPKRIRKPGIAWEDLPHIHVVVVSHNHYDHLDLATLVRLKEKFDPIFLVALGDGVLLRKEGIQRVQEMDWWDNTKVGDVKITFVPAQHWSARGPWDRNLSLWGGFVWETPQLVAYYAGDSGYYSGFRKIRERIGRHFDFAMIPIGAYEPRWFMKDHHMNPEEAVQTHLDVGAGLSMGVHYGTFPLTDEALDDPPKALALAKEKLLSEADREKFVVFQEGETRRLQFAPKDSSK